MTATLETGRQAIKSHDWDGALRALLEVDQEQGLSPDDLMLLGDAHWWSAQPDDARSVSLEVISEPVEVHMLGWR